MRFHRFYIKDSNTLRGETFDVTDRDLIHQWRTVFRYNVGSQVILFDGDGFDYLCIISSLRNLGATLSVVRKIKIPNKYKINLWLCVGIIKKDNFEMVVEKATELGVSHIIPVLCDRSEKKNLNLERLKKISIEASEQSGRGDVPVIHEIISLKDLLSGDILPSFALVLDLEGLPLSDITKENPKDLAVFIGPEGGFSTDELANFKKCNIPSVCLSSQVLRAETAGIAVSSLLLL